MSTEHRNLVVRVALELLDIIRPHLGSAPASEVVGVANSGDYTFALDEEAEKALPGIVASAGKRARLRLAYYSEDRGLVVPESSDEAGDAAHAPSHVLVVDPIDGTRPAICGFESCCVSVALAPVISATGGEPDAAPRALLGQIEAAALIELKSGIIISGQRGQGVQIGSSNQIGGRNKIDGHRLSGRDDIKHLFWAYEVCGRPTAAIQHILSRLIDDSSHGGGCFVFNSSSYAISRLIFGQLDAYIDPYPELLRGNAAEHWRGVSRSLFKNRIMGLFPYDIAAAAFLAQEAGAIITDARGRSLDEINLLDSSTENLLSCVAAANEALHSKLLQYVAEGLATAEKAG